MRMSRTSNKLVCSYKPGLIPYLRKTKKRLCSRSRYRLHLRRRYLLNLRDFFEYFPDECGFIALAPVWHWSQVGRIRFDHQLREGAVLDSVSDIRGVRICCDTCKREEVAFLYEPFHVFPFFRAAMEDE